jgi:electron transfer flavoprotein alpha subunit
VVVTVHTPSFGATGPGGAAPIEQIVAAGDRGVLTYFTPVADKLGASGCLSRPGRSVYGPNDWQVGQTSKVFASECYIAVGISGAIPT